MTLKYLEGHFSLGCHFHVHFSNPWRAFASHGLPAIAELLVMLVPRIAYCGWPACFCIVCACVLAHVLTLSTVNLQKKARQIFTKLTCWCLLGQINGSDFVVKSSRSRCNKMCWKKNIDSIQFVSQVHCFWFALAVLVNCCFKFIFSCSFYRATLCVARS